MLETSWSEIIITGIVFLLVSRPEDLPGMLRSFGRVIAWIRSYVFDLQIHLERLVQESSLDKNEIKAVDLDFLDTEDSGVYPHVSLLENKSESKFDSHSNKAVNPIVRVKRSGRSKLRKTQKNNDG